jgi:hypothetical protein
VKYGSARECRRKFHDERVSSGQRIHNLVNKLGTGLLKDNKQNLKHQVLNEEKLDDTRTTLEHTTTKLLNV